MQCRWGIGRHATAFATFLAVVGLSPAAGMHARAKQQPPDDHFMAETYRFLRASSNGVGKAVEKMLTVQGSLDDMKNDLNSEYSQWIFKKKSLLADRDKLRGEIAKIQAELLRLQSLREEKVRLEGQLQLLLSANSKLAQENSNATLKRKQENQTKVQEIRTLEGQMEGIHCTKQKLIDNANNRTTALKDQNRALQREIFLWSQNLTELQAKAAKYQVSKTDTQNELLSQTGEVQKRIQALEKEVLAQAQAQAEVQRARNRLADQATQTATQRKLLLDAAGTCNVSKTKIDEKVLELRKGLQAANQDMMSCQNLDATNQHLQADLNKCNAGQPS